MKKDKEYLKQLSEETKALKTPLMSYKQVNDLIKGQMIYCYLDGHLYRKCIIKEYKGYLRPNFAKLLNHNETKKLVIYGQITRKRRRNGHYLTVKLVNE